MEGANIPVSMYIAGPMSRGKVRRRQEGRLLLDRPPVDGPDYPIKVLPEHSIAAVG